MMNIIGILNIVFLIYLLAGLKVINQDEYGFVFTLWKYTKILNPWLRFTWPILQTIRRININKTISETIVDLDKWNIPLEIKKEILDEIEEYHDVINIPYSPDEDEIKKSNGTTCNPNTPQPDESVKKD